jgi:chemotaxis signal transduction protein
MSSYLTNQAYLLLKLDSARVAIELSHVAEIMRPLPLEPISQMPPFMLGLSVIRGSPVPVIALDAVLGGKCNESVGRFVTLHIDTRMIALAVKDVLGVGSIDRAGLEALPPLLLNASAAAVELIGTLDSQLLIVLHTSRILTEEMWQSFSGRKAATQ